MRLLRSPVSCVAYEPCVGCRVGCWRGSCAKCVDRRAFPLQVPTHVLRVSPPRFSGRPGGGRRAKRVDRRMPLSFSPGAQLNCQTSSPRGCLGTTNTGMTPRASRAALKRQTCAQCEGGGAATCARVAGEAAHSGAPRRARTRCVTRCVVAARLGWWRWRSARERTLLVCSFDQCRARRRSSTHHNNSFAVPHNPRRTPPPCSRSRTVVPTLYRRRHTEIRDRAPSPDIFILFHQGKKAPPRKDSSKQREASQQQ